MADHAEGDARVEDDDDPQPIPSARQMGIIRVGNALRRARGTMSQRQAAEHFHVPYGTLCAIESGTIRHYGSKTLAQFNEMIGQNTYRLMYEQPDEPGFEIPAAAQADLDELRRQLDEIRRQFQELRVELSALYVTRERSVLEVLAAQLDDAELADVVSYIHFVLGRRRPPVN